MTSSTMYRIRPSARACAKAVTRVRQWLGLGQVARVRAVARVRQWLGLGQVARVREWLGLGSG